ncbi:MAG: HEAT repeat domain-containing protein [Elusimicrobia bacterium]|nr:HEAT repeat domain-containing protein [Elusimicrobiota bacterium]
MRRGLGLNRRSCGLAVLLAAASFARGAPPAAGANSLPADALANRLDELTRQLDEEREQLMLKTVGIGGIAATFEKYAPDSRESAEIRALVVSVLNERRKETTALELKTALLAEQLQRYKETGVLSPTPPATVASLKKLIDSPWAVWEGRKPVASLSLDLAILQKQLRRYQDGGARKAESLPAPSKHDLPPSVQIDRGSAGFERDRGTGKPENDPIPELIVSLSSAEPRRRALAADELGSRGSAAAAAVPALRSALSDPDRRVRASAVLALGAVGSAPADVVADLRRALGDQDAEVRLSAQLALRRLDAPRLTPARPGVILR